MLLELKRAIFTFRLIAEPHGNQKGHSVRRNQRRRRSDVCQYSNCHSSSSVRLSNTFGVCDSHTTHPTASCSVENVIACKSLPLKHKGGVACPFIAVGSISGG